jgi:hypothetical protein
MLLFMVLYVPTAPSYAKQAKNRCSTAFTKCKQNKSSSVCDCENFFFVGISAVSYCYTFEMVLSGM